MKSAIHPPLRDPSPIMNHQRLFLLFLPITLLLPAVLSWYVGRNLLGPWKGRRRLAYATIAGMFVMGLGSCLALILWSEQDRTPIRPLVALGFFALGYLLTAGALLLARDALRLIWHALTRIRRPRASASTRPSRPHAALWLPISSWSLLLVAAICVWRGNYDARRAPVAHQIDVPIQQLGRAFDGYRLAQLTDIHLHGDAADRQRIERLVAEVNALDVDLIAITGDVVNGPLDDLRRGLEPLGSLMARDGIYLALGNHENYADPDACVTEFERLGFHVLLNEHSAIAKGTDRLVIAGVTNPQSGMHGARFSAMASRVGRLSSDPRAAIAGAPPGVPRILLAHQPRSIREARGLGVDLALAGHTHGGQFFPWDLGARLVFPYASGRYQDGSMTVYIGRGIGTFGPPLRLGALPEIPVFRLTRA